MNHDWETRVVSIYIWFYDEFDDSSGSWVAFYSRNSLHQLFSEWFLSPSLLLPFFQLFLLPITPFSRIIISKPWLIAKRHDDSCSFFLHCFLTTYSYSPYSSHSSLLLPLLDGHPLLSRRQRELVTGDPYSSCIPDSLDYSFLLFSLESSRVKISCRSQETGITLSLNSVEFNSKGEEIEIVKERL